MRKIEINRRSFLKTAGALAGVASISGVVTGCNLGDSENGADPNEVTIVKSQCRMCHGTCGTLVHVRNGRVIKVEGYEDS
ncbi:MAG: twin-arginine translocation signal domain-containing protein, partial [Coriobacteriales bacterium]|nr:twin-arginine translocation signal domain-containing protein [Coriobacteriales bacterium]